MGSPPLILCSRCVLNERWVGVFGEETMLNGIPVHAKGCSKLKDAMMYATTPHMFGAGHEANAFSKMCAAVKRPLYGADCYAYALVASGFGADIVVEADLGLYDYCALVPIVEGGGGVMTDWNGERLTLQHHSASMGRVVAVANAELHREAIQILSTRSGNEACTPSTLNMRVSQFSLPSLIAGLAVGVILSMTCSKFTR